VTLRKRILIIEDDPDVREALADALRASGLAVDVAEDGIAGLDCLRAGPVPSLILLDLRLPRLCGEEFLATMRDDEEYAHVPVITMTAGEDPADGADVVAHLHKPFDFQGLLQIVLAVVGVGVA
jgi:DNA-binding response OmpR family regulator